MSAKFKILLVPDVHGRDFWKKPVEDFLKESNGKVIFLGDYLDPYLHEFAMAGNYTPEKVRRKAIDGFKNILEIKKSNPERVTLLVGNHDAGYFIHPEICECRRDYYNYEEIKSLFNENYNLFQLADEERMNGQHYIFSHAGINKKYAELVFGDTVNEANVVSLFNEMYFSKSRDLMSLALYSFYRGSSFYKYGSLIWADAREWDGKDNVGYGFNVVGHTQMKEPYINNEINMAFLDCKKCFVLDEKGNFQEYGNEEESD